MAALTTAVSPRARGARRPALRTVIRVVAGIVVVVATALIVGVGPFLRGVAAISPPSILAALALTAVATAAAAWRWRIVATGFGLSLGWPTAFAAYYRSQFLNAVLPGGIVGDVHRAWAHGRRADRVGPAVRSVAVERILGQAVQAMLTLVVLLSLGQGSLAGGAGALAGVVVLAVATAAAVPQTRRILHREYILLRPTLARPAALLAIVVASAVVVAAHVALFVVAALATGTPLDARGLVPAALVVLAASAIPAGVGGWGPREAAAGAAFALAGLGAAGGVAVSTAFGVLALVAVAPGALVLLADRRGPS